MYFSKTQEEQLNRLAELRFGQEILARQADTMRECLEFISQPVQCCELSTATDAARVCLDICQHDAFKLPDREAALAQGFRQVAYARDVVTLLQPPVDYAGYLRGVLITADGLQLWVKREQNEARKQETGPRLPDATLTQLLKELAKREGMDCGQVWV